MLSEADMIREGGERYQRDDFAGSLSVFEEVVKRRPASTAGWRGVANARWRLDDHEGMIEACKRVARLEPEDPASFGPYVRVLIALGLAEQAVSVARGALGIHPRSADLWQCLCLALNYSDKATRGDVIDAARGFGRAMSALRPPDAPREGGARARGPGAGAGPGAGDGTRPQRLRVGYLSADLREHSVARFIEPVLEHHDRRRFEVFIYSNNETDDGGTARLRAYDVAWRDVRGLDDDAAANAVRADGVDLLVDLSGHTIGHRLGIMARRPAPLQATYLGYPATVGLDAIDLRIVDETTDPLGSEGWCVERLARVEGCFVCYRHGPGMDASEQDEQDESERGELRDVDGARPLVFASLNSTAKISPATIDLWSRVVRGVPGSRLVLKSAATAGAWTRRRLAERFAASGLDASRVEILEPTETRGEHLRTYLGVDVALDCVPYHGTTTTCEAMWMGVPTITLEGDHHASRVGASLLRAAGLERWVASGAEGVVRIARDAAADRAALTALKRGLRARMLGSRLCDERGFVGRLEDLYERAWREHG